MHMVIRLYFASHVVMFTKGMPETVFLLREINSTAHNTESCQKAIGR